MISRFVSDGERINEYKMNYLIFIKFGQIILYSYITNTFDILFKKGGEGKVVDNKRFVS